MAVPDARTEINAAGDRQTYALNAMGSRSRIISKG